MRRKSYKEGSRFFFQAKNITHLSDIIKENTTMIVKTVVTYKNIHTVEPLASCVCIHTLYLSRPGTLQQIQNVKK